MSTITDTEILARRARKHSIARIVKETGAPKKRIHLLLAKNGMLGGRRRQPTKSELRIHLDSMHGELKSLRFLAVDQARQIDELKKLLGALALDLTEPLEAEVPDSAPMLPPVPPRRPRLSRTTRILSADRSRTLIGAQK